MITSDMIISKHNLAAKAFFEAAGAKAAVDSLKHTSFIIHRNRTLAPAETMTYTKYSLTLKDD